MEARHERIGRHRVESRRSWPAVAVHREREAVIEAYERGDVCVGQSGKEAGNSSGGTLERSDHVRGRGGTDYSVGPADLLGS